MYTLGIDIGSTTSKCAVLKDGKELVAHSLQTGGLGTGGPEEALAQLWQTSGLTRADMACAFVTGYGRKNYQGADGEISALTAHALGAQPHRASIAPRKITDDRIRRISVWGMSHRVSVVLSTSRSSPSHCTAQPKYRRISAAESTSLRCGQPSMRHTSPLSSVAARMGSTLFFAPCTATSPRSGVPPSMVIYLMCPPFPVHPTAMPLYEWTGERGDSLTSAPAP